MDKILGGLVLINGTDIWKEYGVFLTEEKKGGRENLNAILGHVDAARTLNGIAAEAAPVKAFVEWRLRTPVPPRTRAVFYPRDGGGLQVVLYPRHPLRPAADNVTFLWGADGRPLGGERDEYEWGAVGLYDAIPVPPSADALTKAVAIYA